MDLSCEGGREMGVGSERERWEGMGEGGEGGVGLNMIKFMVCIYEMLQRIDT